MTKNILELWPQIVAVVGGIIGLFLFALAVALPPRHSKVRPGSKGHRDAEEDTDHEEIRADGYIDSFAGTIEEAGGGFPPVVRLAIPAILIWWLLTLILFWTPK